MQTINSAVFSQLSAVTGEQQRATDPGLPESRHEVEELKSQLRLLQDQLARERGGSDALKTNYQQLVGEFQEQWELRNSIKEISEILAANQDRLAAKKRRLVATDTTDAATKRAIVEEIKSLEELVRDNEDIKYELDKRLNELEEKRARKLGLNPRSVSPIVANRVQKREAIREKSSTQLPRPKLSPAPSNCQDWNMKEGSYTVVAPLTDRATEKKTTTKKPSRSSPTTNADQQRPASNLKPQTSRQDTINSSPSYQLGYPSALMDAGDVLGNKKLQPLHGMSSFEVEVVEIEAGAHMQNDDSGRVEVRKNIDFDAGVAAGDWTRGRQSKEEDDLLVMDLLQASQSRVLPRGLFSEFTNHNPTLADDHNLDEDSHSRILQFLPETHEMQHSLTKEHYSGRSQQSEFEHIKNELHHEIEKGLENSSSRDMRIQEKLQKARERMREFKKKLHLMSGFLEKYEEKALEKGSTDIVKAVVELMREYAKQSYLLSEEEQKKLQQLTIFFSKFKAIHPQLSATWFEDDHKENLRPSQNQQLETIKGMNDRKHAHGTSQSYIRQDRQSESSKNLVFPDENVKRDKSAQRFRTNTVNPPVSKYTGQSQPAGFQSSQNWREKPSNQDSKSARAEQIVNKLSRLLG